jgi:hypothetical protein
MKNSLSPSNASGPAMLWLQVQRDTSVAACWAIKLLAG